MSLRRVCIRLMVMSMMLLCVTYSTSLSDAVIAMDFTNSNLRALQVSPAIVPPVTPSTATSTAGSSASSPTPSPTTKKPVNRPWMTNSGTTTTTTNGTTTSSGGAVVIGVTDDATRPGYSMDTGKSTFLGYFETEKIYLIASYIIPSFFILFKLILFLYFCIVGLDSEEEQERKRKEQERNMMEQEQKNILTPKARALEQEHKNVTHGTINFWIEEELQSWRMDLSLFNRVKPLTTTPNQRRHDMNTTTDDIVQYIGPAQIEYWLASYQHQFVVLKWVLATAKEMEKQQDKLKYQVKRHAKLQHPHVIQLIGVAWSPSTHLVVITEYMTRGDLRQWLHRTAAKETGLWTPLKVQILRNLAQVFEYLHSFQPPLVHGNGNARNVLLNEAMEAKWSDFGGRTDGFRGREVLAYQQVGSGRWISPESLVGASCSSTCSPRMNLPSTASDIYALGILMVEVDTHTLPFTDLAQENEMDLLEKIAKGTISPTLLSTCPPAIVELVQACTAFEPSKRPSAKEVVAALDAMVC